MRAQADVIVIRQRASARGFAHHRADPRERHHNPGGGCAAHHPGGRRRGRAADPGDRAAGAWLLERAALARQWPGTPRPAARGIADPRIPGPGDPGRHRAATRPQREALEPFGTAHVYRRKPVDPATDTDDDPGSAEGRPLCRRPHGAGPAPACRAKPRPARVLMLVQNKTVPPDFRVWQEAQPAGPRGYEVSVICPRGERYTSRRENKRTASGSTATRAGPRAEQPRLSA